MLVATEKKTLELEVEKSNLKPRSTVYYLHECEQSHNFNKFQFPHLQNGLFYKDCF